MTIKILEQAPKQNGCIQDIYHTGRMYDIRLEKGSFASVYTLCERCLYKLFLEIQETLGKGWIEDQQ